MIAPNERRPTDHARSDLGRLHLDVIPTVYFDHTFSEQDLINCAKRCVDLFAPNLVLGISDGISSHGDIERVRLVTKAVDDYSAAL
jgi:hypothetical protein